MIRNSVRKVLHALIALGLALTGLVGAAAPAHAAPTILGAGSTWSALAIDQWKAEVYSKLALSINYNKAGSTVGRQYFAAKTVDFGVSEIPFQPEDPQVNRKYTYLPIVAGGTSMMYNLQAPGGGQIRDLKLSSASIAGIFTGKITRWNDQQILRDYGKALPSTPIKVVVRSDGSGTSYQFSAYIRAMQTGAWKAFTSKCGVSDSPTSFWPSGRSGCLQTAIGQKGSDGVANYISNPGLGVGSIGYVEAGYAVGKKFPVAGVLNKYGTFTIPTAGNVAIALTHAKLHSDSTQDLSQVYVAPEKNAYPISSYSYMIAPTDNTISNDKGAVLGKFINYFACAGQQQAERLGYSPMPRELVAFALDAVKKIPGAPDPPGLDGKSCPNPTLTGDFDMTREGKLDGTDLTGGSNGEGLPPECEAGDPKCDEEKGPRGGGNPNCDPADPTCVPGKDGPRPGDDCEPGDANCKGGKIVCDPADPNCVEGPDGNYRYVTDEPTVLSDLALLEKQIAASEQIMGLRPGSSLPLVILALAMLGLVFGPLFLRMRGRKEE